MRRRASLAALCSVVIVSGCASSSDSPRTAAAPSTAGVASSSATVSPLEGTYRASIDEQAFRDYLQSIGYGSEAADLIIKPDKENLPGPDFQLQFLGNRFQMSYVPTGGKWQSGTFDVVGDEIVLDDEAPVGHFTLTYEVSGPTVRFTDMHTDTPGLEYAAGIPDWVPGAALWSTAPWTRTEATTR